jgi:phage tail sheath protein FI
MRYLTPGVYPQDVYPNPPRSLVTGVPAFLGLAASGPLAPQRLAVWTQFEALYGSNVPLHLADAVRGFFANDGAVCYVLRLEEAAASPVQRLQAGLAALDELDDVDLVCAPDVTSATPDEAITLQRMIAGNCRARGDRFALLDAMPDPGAVDGQARSLRGPDGAFAALYHPWLLAAEPGPQPRLVPPCGHVAGIVSRGDRQVGVHKAPANEAVEGVLDVAAALTASQVGALTAAGVNCVRAVPGRGIRIWGARTLATDPGARDLTARRVISTAGRWIGRFMTGVVHEPHDMRLRVRILRELTAYLDSLYQMGALRGQTPAEAFYVKCDDETNPPSVVDGGMVVTQVGVAPSVPAEFVVVQVIHGANGVRINAS